MSWEDKSRLKRLGEKHDLISLDGCYIKPIKYSIEGEEAINQARLKIRDKFPKGMISKLAKKYKGIGTLTPTEMVAKLTAEEVEELIEQTAAAEPGSQTEHIKLVLLHGIGEHNFQNGEGKPEEVNEDFAARICEDKALAIEMLGVIETHNRPLALKTGSKSGTLPSGSAGGSDSKKGKNSRTAVTRSP